MNVLVTDLFSIKNKGDAAIAEVTLNQLRGVFPEATFKFVTTEPFSEGAEFFGAKLVRSIFFEAVYRSTNPLVRIVRVIYSVCSTLVWVICYNLFGLKLSFILNDGLQKLMEAILEADLVVPKGGGYLLAKNGWSSTLSLLLQLYGIWIPTALHKTVILYSQSVGPFATSLQKWATRYVLNRTKAIFTRESHSVRTLVDIGVTETDVLQSADAALLFQPNTRDSMRAVLEQSGIDLSKPTLGITVTEQLSKKLQHQYELVIAQFASFVASKDMQVVFVPQVISPLHNDDDVIVQKRIQSLIADLPNIFFLDTDFSYHDVKGVYENFDFIVGTRMHSVIFALTGLVPTIAIAYEYKTLGVMESLGLRDWCLEMHSLQYGELAKLFDMLLVQKDEYLQTLKDNLQLQKDVAAKTALQVKEYYLQKSDE